MRELFTDKELKNASIEELYQEAKDVGKELNDTMHPEDYKANKLLNIYMKRLIEEICSRI